MKSLIYIKRYVSKWIPIKYKNIIKTIMVDNNYKLIKKNGRIPFDNKYSYGVNLIGDINAEIGLGQSCRLLAKGLEDSGIPYVIYEYGEKRKKIAKESWYNDKISVDLRYAINIVHVNPYDVGIMSVILGKKLWNHRYNIAFWLWELEDFPEEWAKMQIFFDEIWTPSKFCTDSISKKVNIPVYTIPYRVEVNSSISYERSSFGLPEHMFLYLVMFDCNSSMERKNAKGSIQAYLKAFQEENLNVGLVIKLNNTVKSDLKEIQEQLKNYKNVFYLTDTLSKGEVDHLIASADVYISLHRSEGYGLVMAEAMLLGTPCVATNWSANIDFMDRESACMVDYSFTTIKNDVGFYRRGNRWADADIEQASVFIKKLFEDRTYYDKIVNNGRRKMMKISENRELENRIKKIMNN